MTALTKDARQHGQRLLGGKRCPQWPAGSGSPRFSPTCRRQPGDERRTFRSDRADDRLRRSGRSLGHANRLPYGFAAYAFTASLKTADYVAARLDAGNIGINQMCPSLPDMPIGGVRTAAMAMRAGAPESRNFCNSGWLASRPSNPHGPRSSAGGSKKSGTTAGSRPLAAAAVGKAQHPIKDSYRTVVCREAGGYCAGKSRSAPVGKNRFVHRMRSRRLRYERPATLKAASALLAKGKGQPLFWPAARFVGSPADRLHRARSGRRYQADRGDPYDPEDRERLQDRRIRLRRPARRVRTTQKTWPGVVEAANLIGSKQVQGRCTMTGNLCNASPPPTAFRPGRGGRQGVVVRPRRESAPSRSNGSRCWARRR